MDSWKETLGDYLFWTFLLVPSKPKAHFHSIKGIFTEVYTTEMEVSSIPITLGQIPCSLHNVQLCWAAPCNPTE